MAIQTATMKNTLANAYAGAALFQTIFTSAGPYSSAGTEPTGGSPAFARKSVVWNTGATSNGVVSANGVVFDIPSGTNAQGTGFFTAASAGTYLDGVAFGAAQTFSSQGTYTVTPTYTQS